MMDHFATSEHGAQGLWLIERSPDGWGWVGVVLLRRGSP